MGVSNDGDLMFSCECDEPKTGKIIRSVYRVDFSVENLNKIYEKTKEFRTLMGKEVITHEQFIDFFVAQGPYKGDPFTAKGICARVDDFVGIFWLTDINYNSPPFEASIHYTFFDRRTRGRLNLCRAAIEYIFRTYGFNRLYTRVPLYIKPTIQFVEHIGFKNEGRMRQNTQYKGQLFDTNLYSLLREEVLSREAWLDKNKKRE